VQQRLAAQVSFSLGRLASRMTCFGVAFEIVQTLDDSPALVSLCVRLRGLVCCPRATPQQSTAKNRVHAFSFIGKAQAEIELRQLSVRSTMEGVAGLRSAGADTTVSLDSGMAHPLSL